MKGHVCLEQTCIPCSQGGRVRGEREVDSSTIQRMTLRLMQEDAIFETECDALMDQLIKKKRYGEMHLMFVPLVERQGHVCICVSVTWQRGGGGGVGV